MSLRHDTQCGYEVSEPLWKARSDSGLGRFQIPAGPRSEDRSNESHSIEHRKMRDEIPQQIHWGLSIQDWSKLPHGYEWTTKKKPGHFVIRVRVVKLSDGSLHRYIVQRKCPVSRRDLAALEREIVVLKREVERARIAATDRALLARKNARNSVPPRRKKARR